MVLRSRGTEMTPEWHCKMGMDKTSLKSIYINDRIGHGVITTQPVKKGDFILEYRGTLCTQKEGNDRLQ